MNVTQKNNNTAQQGQGNVMVPLKWVLMPIAIIIVSIALFIVFAAMAPKPEKKALPMKAPLVEVMPLQSQSVNFTIHSQGTVSPRTETILISEVAGQVKKVSPKFFAGGYFEKGELLLEIDPISYEVALLQAQARLDAANARWVEEKARSQQAEHEWLMTGKPLDQAPVLALRKPMLQQAQAEIKAAKADVENAKITLARTKITAPYDALVKQKIVDIGQYVTTGTQLAVTFAVDHAEIRLPIKGHDLPFIDVPKQQTGKASPVAISRSSAKNSHIWKTSLSRSEAVIDSKTRVTYVVATILDPYNIHQQQDRPELPMGTFVEAQITAASIDNVFVIPRAALRANSHVYIINEQQQLTVLPIDILYADKNYFYSRKGLKDGQQLVLTNIQTPVEGMLLRTAETLNNDNKAQVQDDET